MKSIDLTGSNELTCLMQEWLEQKKKLKDAQAKEKELKTSLINTLNRNAADMILCGDFVLERTHVPANEGKEITIDDVGKITGKRAGYDKITISEVKND